MRSIRTIVVALALAAMSMLVLMAPASASASGGPASATPAVVPSLQPEPGAPATSGKGIEVAPDPGAYAACEQGNGPVWTPAFRDRFHSCFLVHTGFDVVEKVDGVPATVGNWTSLWIVTGSASSGSSTLTYTVRSRFLSEWGVPPNPAWTWSSGLACVNYWGATCANSASAGWTKTVAQWFLPQTLTATFNTAGSPGHTPSAAYAGQQLFNGADNLNYHAMSQWQMFPGNPASKSWSNPVYFRGDTAGYFRGKNSGNVYYQVIPTWDISLSGNASQIAANIEQAEKRPGTGTYPSGPGGRAVKIPGFQSTGQPLNRMRNTTQADLNRAVSIGQCLRRNPLYTVGGNSCDEYPMASTYQGAETATRTALTATGTPWWYTVRAVPARQNSSASGSWNTFLRNNRVVTGDPFWVNVVP